MKKQTRGLVIGKFLPPHKGHKYLIDTASAQCDYVDVLVCDSPAYAIPAETRRRWLQEIHPTAHVRIIPDLSDDDNSEAWARHTINFLGYAPDIVFSSEDYGKRWAYYMGCKHQMVDHDRVHIPISATKVRKNILASWEYLEPPVRRDLALRIVVVGAESTGTTTLSQDLAFHYHAPWVPEFGRTYSEALLYANHTWKDADFAYIAVTQQEQENKLAAESNGLLICDTNATATQLWQKRYMGRTTGAVQAIAAEDTAAYYFLTGDEIPFVQDGTRDGEHIRHDMHEDFERMLSSMEVPYTLLRGPKVDRLHKATAIIDKLIADYSLPDPAILAAAKQPIKV